MAATGQSQCLTTQLIFDMNLGTLWWYKNLIAVLLPNLAFESCLQSTDTLGFPSRKKVQENHEHY